MPVHEQGTEAPLVAAPSSFEAFVRSDYAKVVALLRALTGSRVVAEDLAQESFAAAHVRWARVAGLDRPDLWIRRVAVNRAIGSARRRASEQRALERLHAFGDPRLVDAADTSSGDPALWAAVRALPKRQAQVVALVYLDDRSVDEAAEALGMSASTARTHLQRARAGLVEALGAEDEPQDVDGAGGGAGGGLGRHRATERRRGGRR